MLQLSHLPRGSTTSLRIHLSSGSGYLVFTTLVFPSNSQKNVVPLLFLFFAFLFFVPFSVFVIFFLPLSFVLSLFQCIRVAGVGMFCCLSYPVRWHGIAVPTPFATLRCTVVSLCRRSFETTNPNLVVSPYEHAPSCTMHCLKANTILIKKISTETLDVDR